MNLVASTKVDEYKPSLLDAAIESQFRALKAEELLKPGMKVVIKPNLLAARSPSMVITTHPELIAAVARWLRGVGITEITLADTPGGVVSEEILERLYSACGLLPLEGLLRLNRDLSYQRVNGFPILKVVAEADAVIDCCKLKTHGLTVMSGAVKNLFGTLPGLLKPEYHCMNPTIRSFSRMLIKLCETVRPVLSVMDAIDCMEGNGPGGGTPRHVGMLLSSRSPYALDEAAVKLMGLEKQKIPLLTEYRKMGMLKDSITIEGDELIPCNPPFVLPDSVAGREHFFTLAGLFHSFFGKHRVYPVLIPERCVGCGKCAESCPKHIIHIENGKAHFTKRNCIHCLCCQEMCPCHAIDVSNHRS